MGRKKMSYCKESSSGKDKIIFLSEEGDINWDCPCLGSMPSGPCGVEFREAFSCFHHSEAEPKGTDCLGKFMEMNECMKRYPELYPDSADNPEEEEVDEDTSENNHNIENNDKQIVEAKS